MSNYVPNMTEVREAYQFANKDKDEWVAFDEFHLWVEKLQADFVKGAEEHIIKLLEPLGECEPSICGKGCRGQYKCVGWAYRHAIRLIKGENK